MKNPYYIPIPRAKLQGSAKPYWDLVRSCNGSRKKMVNFITGIGGYSDHGDRFAIEFCIKDYYSDTSVENLWKLLTSDKMDVGPDKNMPPEEMTQAKALFWRVYAEHEDNVGERGREEAYEGWKDSDSPYETFEGTRVDWTWEIHGRMGGHLCMTECAGNNLKVSPEQLEEEMNELDDGRYLNWSANDLRKLFIICVQNTVDLESRKISDEIEYRAAWRVWVGFCEDELEEALTAYKQRQDLRDCAGAIQDLLSGSTTRTSNVDETEELLTAFKAICQLADISIGE